MTENIGKKCEKVGASKKIKPFKSGLKQNTIKGIIVNPHTNKLAYTFLEDDSCVNVDKCRILS